MTEHFNASTPQLIRRAILCKDTIIVANRICLSYVIFSLWGNCLLHTPRLLSHLPIKPYDFLQTEMSYQTVHIMNYIMYVCVYTWMCAHVNTLQLLMFLSF